MDKKYNNIKTLILAAFKEVSGVEAVFFIYDSYETAEPYLYVETYDHDTLDYGQLALAEAELLKHYPRAGVIVHAHQGRKVIV